MFAPLPLQQHCKGVKRLQSLVIFPLFLVPFLFGGGCRSETKMQVVSEPSPSSLLLLFPRGENIGRAVLADLEEYNSGAIEVIVNEGEIAKVSIVEFTLSSSPEQESRLLAALNHKLVEWGKESDYEKLRFSSTDGVNRLEVYGKNGPPRPMTFLYRLRDDGKVEFMEPVSAR